MIRLFYSILQKTTLKDVILDFSNTFNLYGIFNVLYSDLVFWCVLMFSVGFDSSTFYACNFTPVLPGGVKKNLWH